MRKSGIIALGFVIAGCSSTPELKPIVNTEVVTVTKEVHISCIKEVPQPPVFIVDDLPKNQTISEKVKALKIDRLLSKSYIQELEAIIAGCK